MSSARENILQCIKQANLRRSSITETDVVGQRLQRHARGPQLQWREDRLTRFIQKAEQSAATVERIKSKLDIADVVERCLKGQALDKKLLITGTTVLKSLEWPDEFVVETRAATVDDKAIVVEAFAGVAETGSIVMCSGKETPVSLNFLPDYFIGVIDTNRIVDSLEDVWDKIRTRESGMPRAINIITGPSRTADVEQIIQLGAHGPRQVHLLLMDL
jgi:L-lactate dehydrogenase complex protein LldG